MINNLLPQATKIKGFWNFFLKIKLPVIIILVAMQHYSSSAMANTGNFFKESHKKDAVKLSIIKEISGKVVNELGEPLNGVSIIDKGTSNGTSSGADGSFVINVKDENAILVFSSIGYDTKELRVGASNSLTVTLIGTKGSMDEVVVVGFGTQKKVNLTGAVSTINSKTLDARPVTSATQALQGVIPGLNISTAGYGGELNQGMSINVRGLGTIGQGSSSSPLILIDGMDGNINAINIQDIESISVLKDAAAASIYGSRAAFGVILVTTKKGKSGKATVNYNNNFRFTSPINLPHMLDSYKFAMYFNEASLNDGGGDIFNATMIKRIKDYQAGTDDSAQHRDPTSSNWPLYTGSNGNTNWFDVWYKKSAFAHDHNISVNGGTDKNQYYLSANYLGQDGLLNFNKDHLDRYTFTGKINAEVSKYVKVSYTSRFIRQDYGKPTHMNDLFYHNIARRWPTLPVYDPNGHYAIGTELVQMVEGGRSKDVEDWLYQQGKIVITPMKNWNITADLNYKIYNRNLHQEVLPAYGYNQNNQPVAQPVYWESGGASKVYEYNNKSDYFGTNLFSDYSFRIGEKHNFKLLAGFNSELNKYRDLGASRRGLITPLIPTINTATTDSKAESGGYGHWATAGFFGRINYDYESKYLLELNGRYDGSSRFLRDKRWNFFPSVSAGWNIANESFFPTTANVQVLKLRASYGSLGNQATTNWYPFYLTQPFGVNNGNWLLGGQQPNTAYAPGLISGLLTWESVSSWNLGLDVTALNNHLDVTAEYFKRKTFNMVGPAPELPVILGTDVPVLNNTDMESKGWELTATWRNRAGNLNYSIRGVLSDATQTVTKYPNVNGNISNYYDGRKVGEIWGYTTIGIAKSQADMNAHLASLPNGGQNALGGNWQGGDIMYKDINGDGKIDGGAGLLSNSGDRTIIGNSTPRYMYGLDLNADWQGIDVRIFFQGVAKRDWAPNGPYFWGANQNMWQSAGFEEHMDFYRDANSPMVKAGLMTENLNAYYPRVYFDGGGKNTNTQTRYLQNASYLRLKNVQVGYSLPFNLISKLGISKTRIYLSGENLLTLTKLSKVFDPETVGLSGWNDGKTYPLSKVISVGLSVTF
jgi:TonB-linked SusC/RagA family outer membrane protein